MRVRVRDLILIPVIVVLVVVGTLIDPVFLTPGHLMEILRQQTELSLLVLAEAVILIAGRFDLSLESTVALAPALAVGLVVPVAAGGLGVGLAVWLAIPLCLLIGAAVGALNGLLILRFQLSAFVVTLGMLITVRGLHTGFTGGERLSDLPSSVAYLGRAHWLGLPASIWICGLIFAAGIAFLGYFRHGRALYAIGGNINAARAAGVRTSRIVWIALIAGGVLAALAGLLMAGRVGSIAATQGQGMIFTVLAAAVIGGVTLDGGKGTIFGALCGVLVLGLTESALKLAGVAAQWIQAVYGAVILVALVLARLTSGQAQDRSD